MNDVEKIIWYRQQAIEQWDAEEECDVPRKGRVVAGEEGAWVEAWLWIDAPYSFQSDDEEGET